jgi:hypothetical protein
LGQVDVTRVFSRIEEIRGNARAKIFEVANRLPVSPPILREIEGQGLIGALSDRLPEGGILQGKGPILSRLMGPTPNTPLKKEEKPTKAEEKPRRTREESYSEIQI